MDFWFTEVTSFQNHFICVNINVKGVLPPVDSYTVYRFKIGPLK